LLKDADLLESAAFAAQDRNRLYELLLNSFPNACILLVSDSGIVRSIHGEAQNLLGIAAQQILGCRLNTYETAAHLGISQRRLHRLAIEARRKGRAVTEAQLLSEEKQTAVQLTLVHLGEHFLCVLTDLSQFKSMEVALLKRNHELQLAAERLKEIDMLKNEFMSNVSHELRTPLTAIAAYTETLRMKRPDDETLSSFLKVIADQSDKLQQLIAGLLDISKLDSLATELKLKRASFNAIVYAAVVTVSPTAEQKRILITTDLEESLPLIFLDELRSQQIVWNLLNNAIKFSPTGGSVRIRTWSDPESIFCSITDEGSGIAPEFQDLIFEKFVQVDGSSTRKQGGVGLGLNLVRHLLALHGGTISVQSTPGEGACFTFSIPIEKRKKNRLNKHSAAISGSHTSK